MLPYLVICLIIALGIGWCFGFAIDPLLSEAEYWGENTKLTRKMSFDKCPKCGSELIESPYEIGVRQISQHTPMPDLGDSHRCVECNESF